jgi:hypothetical protein
VGCDGVGGSLKSGAQPCGGRVMLGESIWHHSRKCSEKLWLLLLQPIFQAVHCIAVNGSYIRTVDSVRAPNYI